MLFPEQLKATRAQAAAAQANAYESTQRGNYWKSGGAGTMKHVAVPIASRTAGKGTGSFVIDGDVADTSTMDWTILQ